MQKNLMKLNVALRQSELGGSSRSASIEKMAKTLGVTIPTLYRWIKSDDHFICAGDVPGTVKLFKEIKEVEVL